MSLRALSRQLEMIPLAVAYCIGRGEAIARENGYRLIGKFFTFLVAVGMPVTRHPPHRSQHALLMHWAPTSGQTQRR